MRCIVTISLPEELCSEMSKEMKQQKFESKSEFVRFLFRQYLENKSKNNK